MSYPKIDNDNFNKRITNKFSKYKVPKEKKTFKQICFPDEFELQPPQLFLANFLNPQTPYKGILIYHRIGAGKTCTAVTIAEKWKELRKIIVVVPASLVGNFRGELRSKCGGSKYLTDSERAQLKLLHPSSKAYKKIIQESDDRIDKYYKIYSYNKFVDDITSGDLNLKNSLLIIDEIQNMVSEKGSFYNTLYNAIKSAPKELRIVLLSATPMFDKPVEIALTMNLLRLPNELPTGVEFEKLFLEQIETSKGYEYRAKNLDIFKDHVKGYISYFRGAPPYVFPQTTIKYVKSVMSDFQYKSYVTVLKKEEDINSTDKERIKSIRAFKKGQLLKLPNDFFIGTRLISNVAFPNTNINQKGFKSFTGKYLKGERLMECSIKFYKILNKIKSSKGPVFVYSNFVEYGGLKSFIRVLEENGFQDYNEYGEGRKRFGIMSGDEKASYKDEIKAVYNQSANINGSKLKILLLSPSAKEGISLFNVRQAHILEPYWNVSRLSQIIGRANRYCSHKSLPKTERELKVYIYLSVHPNERMTIDQHIARIANQKNKLINEFERAMKEVAVDCQLNQYANQFKTKEDNFKCDL
jgi:hypothetical protein